MGLTGQQPPRRQVAVLSNVLEGKVGGCFRACVAGLNSLDIGVVTHAGHFASSAGGSGGVLAPNWEASAFRVIQYGVSVDSSRSRSNTADGRWSCHSAG
jgi:hypothetical protein